MFKEGLFEKCSYCLNRDACRGFKVCYEHEDFVPDKDEIVTKSRVMDMSIADLILLLDYYADVEE